MARQPRADRGCRSFPPDLIHLTEGLALQVPARSIAAIHRRTAAVAADQGWPTPSYGTVYGIVRRLHPGLVTLARDGPKAYRECFDLIHRREAEGPNGIWQADHTRLDVWIRDEHDRPAKPWLTVILDDYSRAVAGCRLSFAAPQGQGVGRLLDQPVQRRLVGGPGRGEQPPPRPVVLPDGRHRSPPSPPKRNSAMPSHRPTRLHAARVPAASRGTFIGPAVDPAARRACSCRRRGRRFLARPSP